MKISIVVPVYNVEQYIRKCIESIENQVHTDFECILVDDGSTDSSGAVCDAYALKDSRFRVVHKKNGGLVSARKAGVQEAACQYVCFVDSDDYIGPGYLKSFADIIEAYAPDLIANNFIETFDGESSRQFSMNQNCGFYEGERLETLKNGLVFDESVKGFNTGIILPSLCLKCTKRTLLAEQYLTCDESISMGEDAMISFPLTLRCRTMYIACFDGYYYRKNPDSIVRKFNSARFDMMKKLSAYLNQRMPSHQTQISYYTVYRLYNEIISAGRSSDTLSLFVRTVNSKLTKEEINAYTKLQPPSLNWKNRVLLFLIRRREWKLLYMIVQVF